MGDDDTRLLRQIAHGHRRTQRIFFVAQMADDANIQTDLLCALRYARKLLSRLIDHFSFAAKRFGSSH